MLSSTAVIDFEKAIRDGEAEFLTAIDSLRNEVLQLPAWKSPVEWIFTSIRLQTQDSNRVGWMMVNGYQRPVAMDAMSGEVDQITILKGGQVGYSSFIKAVILYALAYLAIKCIVAQPTIGDAQGYYNDELEPRFLDVKP